MRTYKEWAEEITRDYGIKGAEKLIIELQKAVTMMSKGEIAYTTSSNHTSRDYSGWESRSNSLSHQINSIESGNITHR